MASTAQRVLLTGGAGFVGSHLAEALLRRGSQLAIVDELNDFYSPQRKEENLAEVRRSGAFEFVQLAFATGRDYTPSSSVSGQTLLFISRLAPEFGLLSMIRRSMSA